MAATLDIVKTDPKDSTEITDLCNKIARFNAIYYNTGISPIPDEQYDMLKRRLREIAPQAPILTQVGAPVAKDSLLTKAEHKIHMGSVANALDRAEFEKWWAKHDPLMVVCSLKVDGLSMDLEYEQGKLMRAITRGDGAEGEDVTMNIIAARNLPLYTHKVDGRTFTGSVRAEVLLYNEDWREVDPQAKNPRNAAAGLVRRKSDQSKAHHLRVLAHDIQWEGNSMRDWAEAFDTMERLGFLTPGVKTASTIEGVAAYHDEIEARRAKLDYEIDGLVIAIRDMRKFKDLGIDGEHCPRGQVAWKFTSMKAIAKLNEVVWTVGHTGALNPVARIEPTELAGVTVSNISLCNPDEINRLQVHIGDDVEIARQGDVIPKILRVVCRRPGPVVPTPEKCPVCNSGVGRRKVGKGKQAKESAAVFCMNDECPAKSSGKLKRWITSLDIKGLGDGVVEALMDGWEFTYAGGITRDMKQKVFAGPADLYRLTVGNLSMMPFPAREDEGSPKGKPYGQTRAVKLIEEIGKKKELTVDEFLGSLGVIHLGKRRVQIIREAWVKAKGQSVAKPDYLSKLAPWFSEVLPDVENGDDPAGCYSFICQHADILGIPGIAPQIQKGLDEAKAVVDDLLAAGVKIVAPDPVSAPAADARLAGKSFCFSGCRMDDTQKVRLQSLGGDEKSGVSKGLSFLVVKDASSTSSKAVKAKEVGAEVIGLDKFEELIA